jgi:hypothetical protein
VNYLGLAGVTRRKRVPLLWTLLPHGGGSASAARIALMRRYLARFPVGSIRFLLGDREFDGVDWLQVLNDNNSFFAIRLRGDLRVTDEAGHELTLHARLHRARGSRVIDTRLGTGENAAGAPLFRFAAKYIEGEWLIVCSNRPTRAALDADAKRWQIECLFAEAKTRGLNIEGTCLTDPRKLDLLMTIVALALAWAAATATTLLGSRAPAPARKAHGYLSRSWFRIGFDHLRHALRTGTRQVPFSVLPRASVGLSCFGVPVREQVRRLRKALDRLCRTYPCDAIPPEGVMTYFTARFATAYVNMFVVFRGALLY